MTLGIPTHQDAEMRMYAAVSGEKQRWPCLSSSIAVTVSPLRNLTGDASQQALVEAFTEELVSNLRRHGRGFLLQQITNEPRERLEPIGEVEQGSGYLVTGSTQRGSPGMLRVNVRITDAATSEYLWARRYEFKGEETELVQARIIRRISRELHVLLLLDEIRQAALTFTAEPDPQKCLASAAIALEGELRPELTAEAQQWFLAALVGDPRNVEALVGLARTCQELVSNPWWSDPVTAAIASDLGREMIAIALDLAPGHAYAHCVQGMLYSAAGELNEAARAFERALAMDQGQAIAQGFAGYNAGFLGDASQTLPAMERAMRLDRTDRRHSIWFFFGGFSELLQGRAEASIALLRKSLERNPSYGSARLFLMAALSLSGRHNEAAKDAASFRQQYPDCPASAFEQLWINRSESTTYRAQILPLFERIRELGVAT
jgi:TolB-like protein/Tfp pilus assembly protein PilF